MQKKLLLFFLGSLFSLETLGGGLSLAEVNLRALSYDAKLAMSQADNAAQKQEIDIAFAGFLPKVSASLYSGRGVTDKEPFINLQDKHRVYDSKNFRLSVTQPLFNKANFSTYNIAKETVARSDNELEKDKKDLIQRAVGAYLNITLAIENVGLSQVQKDTIGQQLEQAKRNFEAGSGSIIEINESQAAFENVLAQEIEWNNALLLSKKDLENIIGPYNEDHFFKLDASKINLDQVLQAKLEELLGQALIKNHEIISARHEAKMADYDIDRNRASHLPTLDLVASKAKTESDSNFTIGNTFNTETIGLQLNVPIFSGGYTNAKVNQSVATLEKAMQNLNDKERTVTSLVKKYFNEVQNGVAKIKAYEKVVSSYEVSLKGTQKGFEFGTKSNIDILNVNEKLTTAKRDLVKEYYQLIMNLTLLKQSTGILNTQDIEDVNKWLCISVAS
jgi:TolC family type I secretion outer membrane protein